MEILEKSHKKLCTLQFFLRSQFSINEKWIRLNFQVVLKSLVFAIGSHLPGD